VERSGGVAPPLLISALDGCDRSASQSVRFTLGKLAPQYPLDRRPGEVQSRFKYQGEHKIHEPAENRKPMVQSVILPKIYRRGERIMMRRKQIIMRSRWRGERGKEKCECRYEEMQSKMERKTGRDIKT
jgi:hypothetical protein